LFYHPWAILSAICLTRRSLACMLAHAV